MKKFYILIMLMLFSSNVFAKDVRVYVDYNPVKILQTVGDSDLDTEAAKAGLKGNFKLTNLADIPSDRSERESWKFKDGRIVVDPTLKKAIEDKKEKKRAAKQALTEKLKTQGFDEEEVKVLIGE